MERKHKYIKLTWVVLSHPGEMSSIDSLVKSLVTPLLKGKNVHLLYQLDEVRYSKETQEYKLIQPMGSALSYSKAQYKVGLYLEEMQQMHCTIQVTVWGTIYDKGL